MKKINWSFLINPFTKIAGWQAFAIGIVIVAATVLVGYTNNIYFPGLLSVKMPSNITLANAFLFQFIGLASIVILMYLSALIFAKNIRFQDILGTVTLSRAPFLILAALGFIVGEISESSMIDSIKDGTFNLTNHIGLFIFGLLCILFCIWVIALLYNAFKVSTGIRNNRILIFIAVIILSEILAGVIIYLI